MKNIQDILKVMINTTNHEKTFIRNKNNPQNIKLTTRGKMFYIAVEMLMNGGY